MRRWQRFVVEHDYDRFTVHTTKTGKLAWQGEGNVRAGDRTRIVVHHEARLHALSAATGKPQWHSPLALSGDDAFGVALTADAVFVANATTGQVHYLEAAIGTVRWTINQKCANTSPRARGRLEHYARRSQSPTDSRACNDHRDLRVVVFPSPPASSLAFVRVAVAWQ